MIQVFLKFVTVFLLVSFALLADEQKELTISDAQKQRIETFLQDLTANGFAGSVAVGNEKELLFDGVYGETYNSPRKPIDENTLFWTASVAKSITAIAILRLVETEKLWLDDPLSRFFPSIPAEMMDITIAHLLTHTSGFPPNSYTPEESADFDEAIKNILNADLVSVPGTDFNYSNDGYFLLAHIVDMVAGASFENYVQEQIFEPAAMNQTQFWQNLDLGQDTRFAGFLGGISPLFLEKRWALRGYNGISTNGPDLYRLVKALKQGKILIPDSLVMLWDSHLELSTLNVGYGWFLSKPGDSPLEITARGSDDFGGNAIVSYFPDHDLIISVTTNAGPIEYDSSSELYRWVIKEKVREIILGVE